MNTKSLSRRNDHPFTGLIESFFDEATRRGGNTSDFSPRVDLSRTEEAFFVQVDLPGMTRDDIHLALENDTLTLSGERKFEAREDGPQFDRIERTYGSFSRTFHLPTSVDSEAVKATFENGVLTVELPKAEKARSRQIEIH